MLAEFIILSVAFVMGQWRDIMSLEARSSSVDTRPSFILLPLISTFIPNAFAISVVLRMMFLAFGVNFGVILSRPCFYVPDKAVDLVSVATIPLECIALYLSSSCCEAIL